MFVFVSVFMFVGLGGTLRAAISAMPSDVGRMDWLGPEAPAARKNFEVLAAGVASRWNSVACCAAVRHGALERRLQLRPGGCPK